MSPRVVNAPLAGRVGTSLDLSAITFGSMRLNERAKEDGAWEALLIESIEAQVTTFHSSDEYESFPRFCELMRRPAVRARSGAIQHIVKLADPHFGQLGFDGARLRARVDSYLAELGAPRLDVLQWMWRGDLEREDLRLDGLARDAEAIAATFGDLERAGKIGAVLPFPYTPAFADRVLVDPTFHGLTVYLNPLELGSVDQVVRAAELGKSIVALRPLAVGRAMDEARSARDCVRWVLAHPAVATTVVSYSSSTHLRHLLGDA